MPSNRLSRRALTAWSAPLFLASLLFPMACGGRLSDASGSSDTDADGVTDALECPAEPCRDTDGDGLADLRDADDDGDSLLTQAELHPLVAQSALRSQDLSTGDPDGTGSFTNSDGDAEPNYLDADDDGDAIPTLLEQLAAQGKDVDDDGVPNYLDEDSDGDGLEDLIEGASDPDTDGAGNYLDEDSDDDLLSDTEEGASDPDGDGLGNFADPDSDNDTLDDGVEVAAGTSPVSGDSDADGLADGAEGLADTDGDGAVDANDIDSDGDGLGDGEDEVLEPDSDGDGEPNAEDLDLDGDGVDNELDADPRDRYVCQDSDGDSCDDCWTGWRDPSYDGQDSDYDLVCDAGDPDDDGDSVPDAEDAFPYYPMESRDQDGDGFGDNMDPDDDGDGTPDLDDPAPLDASLCGDSEYDGCNDCASGVNDATRDGLDSDGDGRCDLGDYDDDGDGVGDYADAFPLDPTQWSDRDGDGLGESIDPDDDGDGVLDKDDAFPVDPTESEDSDDDGWGDQLDPDDDGDGALDEQDAFPRDPFESSDADGDGLGDVLDSDDDNDGALDKADVEPRDPRSCGDGDTDACDDCALGAFAPSADGVDTDADGACDAGDPDDDSDGVQDTDELAQGTDPLDSASLDECASGLAICPTPGRCEDRPLGFDCACPDGYEGDGGHCTDIDECAVDHGGCDARAKCWNLPGSHECECAEGRVRRGQSCDDFGVVRALSAEPTFVCALLRDGAVKCWGDNAHGQLGQGHRRTLGDEADELGDALPPIDLGSGRFAVQLGTGLAHACARLDDGEIKCWGSNASGQLGLSAQFSGDIGLVPSDLGDHLESVALGTGRRAVDLAVGDDFTCVLLDDGTTTCWGAGGRLGAGDALTRGNGAVALPDGLVAVDWGTGRRALDLDAGSLVCAVLDDHSVKCFGAGAGGVLGQGDTETRGDEPGELGDALLPVALGPGALASSVHVGRGFACAELADGALKCWGANRRGQLGLGDVASRGDQADELGVALPPVDLGAGRRAQAVSLGLEHTCAVLDDDTVSCWGYDGGSLGLGQVGNVGDEPSELGDGLPSLDVVGSLAPVAVAAGHRYQCALFERGQVRCWGANPYGVLGQGDTLARVSPPFRELPYVELGGAGPAFDADGDGDGVWDRLDAFPDDPEESGDADGDGVGDGADDDADNDGLSDDDESARGTNPLLADTDGDGQRDDVDEFPLLDHECYVGPAKNLSYCDFAGQDLRALFDEATPWMAYTLEDSDLSFADLSGANLTGFNLSFVNLDGARLEGATLTGVGSWNVRGTPASLPEGWRLVEGLLLGPGATVGYDLLVMYLGGADLHGIDLSSADLRNVDFTGADLTGANLTGAYAWGANFERANLTGANLTGANLTGAAFAEAQVDGATFTDARMSGVRSGQVVGTPSGLPEGWYTLRGLLIGDGADLSGMDLRGSDFAHQDLTGVVLAYANLSAASLASADLTRVVLDGANLDGTVFTGATLKRVRARRISNTPSSLPAPWTLRSGYLLGPAVDLSGRDLSGPEPGERLLVDLSALDLRGADLRDATLPYIDLQSTNLAGADARGANLTHAQMRDVNAMGLDARGAALSSADLSGATVAGLLLEDARLSFLTALELRGTPGSLPPGWALRCAALLGPEVNATDANLSGCDLSDLDLRGALLRRADLSGANLTSTLLFTAALYDADLTGATVTAAELDLERGRPDGLIEERPGFSGARACSLRGAPASLPRHHALLGGCIVGPELDLDGADLSGVTFPGLSLAGASLEGATLTGAVFDGCDLSHAHLGSAGLRGARFWSSDLSYSDFGQADMTGATVNGCFAVSSDWRKTLLVDAALIASDFTDADFRDTNLTGAELRDCQLGGSFFLARFGGTTGRNLLGIPTALTAGWSRVVSADYGQPYWDLVER